MTARFGRFAMVGLLGAALQVIVFHFLIRWAHLPGPAAATVAVELALLHNFFWHERFTWRDREAQLRRGIRLVRFHAANGLVSLGGNALLAWWLVERLKAPAMPSALIAIAVCAPVNFWIADRWVYRILWDWPPGRGDGPAGHQR